MFDNLQGSLADVVGSTPDYEDDGLYGESGYDWWHDDYDDEPEPYDLHEDDDYDDEPPEDNDPDEFDIVLPRTGSLSPSRHHFGPLWDGKRRRIDNSHPKHKDHRS